MNRREFLKKGLECIVNEKLTIPKKCFLAKLRNKIIPYVLSLSILAVAELLFNKNEVFGQTYYGKLTFQQVLKDNQNGVDGLFGANSVMVSPDNKNVYATGVNDEAVVVFQRESTTGKLTFLEYKKVDGPYSVTVSPDNKNVYAASCFDHAVVVFTRDLETGKLTFLEYHKDGVDGVDGLAAALSVTISPDNKNVYATGNIDNAVVVFQRDSTTGKLTFLEYKKHGVELMLPFSVTVSPDNKNVYVTGYSDAVAVFQRDLETGKLTFLEYHKDDVGGVDGLSCSRSVTVSPDNKNVYAAGTGEHAVAVFQRDLETGKLMFLEYKKQGVDGVDGLLNPFSVTVSPDNKNVYVASCEGDAVAVFQRDSTTGKLTFLEYKKDGIDGVDGLDGARFVIVSPDNKNVYVVGEMDHAVAVFSRDITTSTDEKIREIKIHEKYKLFQNYPNPFNPNTTIEYYLPKISDVRLDIYNILGQKIKTLVNQKKVSGKYSVMWDGKAYNGINVPSGIYFYRLQTSEFVETKKILLLK